MGKEGLGLGVLASLADESTEKAPLLGPFLFQGSKGVISYRRIGGISIVLVLVAVLFVVPFSQAAGEGRATVYFFYGEGCPHCEMEKPFLEEMKRKYPGLLVKSFEVWHDRENAKYFSALAEAYGISASGVPTTFIGGREPIVGFRKDGTTAGRIESEIQDCLEKVCPDPGERLALPAGTAPPLAEEDRMVDIPGVGLVDVTTLALPLITIVLGSLDSFNPCAFFVLLTLLGMLVHAGTKGRMLLIGGIFVFFSGFIYFLFMSAWLNFFLYVGEFRVVTVIAGLVALAIAAVNIKDFFFFKRGVSLVIPETAKPRLFDRMRGLLKATSVTSMVLGAAVLAVAANTYELLCTAGFPMVFTRILTLHDLSRPTYYFYLAAYNLVYVIPLAVIVVIAAITMGAKKLSEQQGRGLKLVSGLMMLGLGLVILVDPALFNNLYTGVALLLTALLGGWLVMRFFGGRAV